MLNLLCQNKQRINWPDYLDIISVKNNTSFRRKIADTPYYKIFGKDFIGEGLVKEFLQCTEEGDRWLDLVEGNIKRDNKINFEADKKMHKSNNKSGLAPGDLVWWINPVLRKLDMQQDLWRTMKILGNNLYEVKNVVSGKVLTVSKRSLVPVFYEA
eukprot:snap_masked-scaffold_1-processed-gene-17.29-mRNA-1 protein AED:1.00 eAED:1.00 QI:0/0/0/0/1/1/2/0/155